MSSYLKRLMNTNKQQIIDKINVLNINNKNKSHFYLYFYCLILDGKKCLKIGVTTQQLHERIYQYLYVEYKKTPKNMDTFNVLAVFNFNSKKIMQMTESIIKCELQKFPLIDNQHSSVEQYCFNKSWTHLEKFIKKPLLFSDEFWIHPDLDNIANSFLSCDANLNQYSIQNSNQTKIINIMDEIDLNPMRTINIIDNIDVNLKSIKNPNSSKIINLFDNTIDTKKFYNMIIKYILHTVEKTLKK